MSTQTQSPAKTIAVNLAVTLVAFVAGELGKLDNVKDSEELRVALGNLFLAIKPMAPAHFGTREEKLPHRVKFSSDKATRKAQMAAFKEEEKACRSVIGKLKAYAENRGLGVASTTYGASRSASGNVTFRESEFLRIKRKSVGNVTL